MDDPRTPLLVGVGTALDDVEAAELMIRATRAAGDDAGVGASLLAAVEQIAVPRGTWSYSDPARLVAAGIGAERARTVLVDLGIPQQTLVNQALAAIAAGEVAVALVVGAEARARAARAAKASVAADASGLSQVLSRKAPADEGASEVDQGGAAPDEHQRPTGGIVSQAEIDARLFAPVEQYAMMESARRAADGLSILDHRRDVASLWAQFNAEAQTNPEAAFPTPMSVDDLATFGPGNRPLAFPYGKWHASQWTVDQGAALLLCSRAAADRFGVAPDRRLHPLVGVESSFELPLTNRRRIHRWPAMGVLGRAAAERIGRPLADCDHVEVYSCFPVAVRVQQHELGLRPDRAPTVTGGMTFAGGPLNSFVLHATAAVARGLRERPGLGLVTTVSGLLTKPGLAVWSSDGDGRPPLVADLAADAEAATEAVESRTGHDGRATVVACTVTYAASEPYELIAVLDTPEDVRVIARSDDPALVTRATEDELVGQRFRIEGDRLAG